MVQIAASTKWTNKGIFEGAKAIPCAVSGNNSEREMDDEAEWNEWSDLFRSTRGVAIGFESGDLSLNHDVIEIGLLMQFSENRSHA